MTRMIIGASSALRPPALKTRRRLHRGHFAFMRALIQGMDEKSAWARYLHEEGEPNDIRRVRSTILWIKDTFAAAARRESRPGTARLIQLDPTRFTERVTAPKLPSLEEFALAQGLEDFSEDEQLEAFLAAYPDAGTSGSGGKSSATGGGTRRARVVDRQLEALRWLEHLVVHDPKPLDGVEAWLSPSLSARLRRGRILTLQDLAHTMNSLGARWWRTFPGIGRHKAARLAEWLRSHAPLLQITLADYAVTPRRQLPPETLQALVAPATAVVPLEKLVVPQALDGRFGANRAPAHACRIPVEVDLQAVEHWIAAKAPKKSSTSSQAPLSLSATQRSYRKESERLLIWAILERRKALSSLSAEDMQDFFAFLLVPPVGWCGSRSTPRWSPQWRPLEGALSPAAHRQARVILHGLFAYLVQQGYLQSNPLHTSGRRSKPLLNQSEAESFQECAA